jgi:hypothetical protein
VLLGSTYAPRGGSEGFEMCRGDFEAEELDACREEMGRIGIVMRGSIIDGVFRPDIDLWTAATDRLLLCVRAVYSLDSLLECAGRYVA